MILDVGRNQGTILWDSDKDKVMALSNKGHIGDEWHTGAGCHCCVCVEELKVSTKFFGHFHNFCIITMINVKNCESTKNWDTRPQRITCASSWLLLHCEKCHKISLAPSVWGNKTKAEHDCVGQGEVQGNSAWYSPACAAAGGCRPLVMHNGISSLFVVKYFTPPKMVPVGLWPREHGNGFGFI